jgi:transketolase C-terminal domain/subunit
MEGGIGPVAGSSHHSLVYRMPGIKVVSPMTSKEYLSVYDKFLSEDDPYYVSEHRKSYDNIEDLNDIVLHEKPDFTLFPISITRFEMEKLLKIMDSYNVKINVFNIFWLKPLFISDDAIQSLFNSKYGGLVLDDDYVLGCQSSIANILSDKSNKIVRCLGIQDKTAGFYSNVDNLPPSADQIAEHLLLVKNKIYPS